jgi:hypothetical protein
MNSSQTIALLAASLVSAQAKIEGAKKDATNPHFRSKYADLAAVVEAIKKPATDNGLTWTQIMHDAENAAKVETIILHKSGEWLSCGVISVPVTKNDAQGFGSALTYARRYSLLSAFGVAPEDDDGNAAAAAAPKMDVKPASGAREQLKPDQLKKVESTASSVIDCFEAGYDASEALKIIEEADFDADEKVALWTFLDSKQRAALKKAAEAQRKRVMDKELATQP